MSGVNDKLMSQREVELTNLLAHAMDEKGKAMRENERLREALAQSVELAEHNTTSSPNG